LEKKAQIILTLDGRPITIDLYSSLFMLIRYVVVLVEAIAVIAISSVWPILSYKQTNLVERSATLTMIIIGEGIVGLASSVSTIATGCTKVTSEDIGIIVAAFLLLVELMITLPPRDHLLISSSVLLMDTLF
jgi:low temperature requirement protein LtrA